MSYKLTKLDKRHSGNHIFKYYVSPISEGSGYKKILADEKTLLTWRQWCWETYGPGSERDLAHHIRDEIVWGWDTKYSKIPRLYLKSDKELALFSLKFSQNG